MRKIVLRYRIYPYPALVFLKTEHKGKISGNSDKVIHMLYDELAKIPYSKTVYIGGYRAFNIYSSDDTGDWHTVSFWDASAELNANNIMGLKNTGYSIDTSRFFGDKGIFLANKILKDMGIPEFAKKIYASSHARTFADLVIIGIKKGKPLNFFEIQDFDDFMHSDENKQKTYHLLREAKNLNALEKIQIENWIKKTQTYK